MTMTSPGPADPLFGAEAELHLALEHPNDLLICVAVRLDMNAGPNALHQTTKDAGQLSAPSVSSLPASKNQHNERHSGAATCNASVTMPGEIHRRV
jgi:hypothetical protein